MQDRNGSHQKSRRLFASWCMPRVLWRVACGVCLLAMASGCKSMSPSLTSKDPDRHVDEFIEEGMLEFLKPEHEERAICAIADAQLSAQRFDMAEEMYQRALEENPKYTPAYLGRAQIRTARDRPDQALAILTDAETKCRKSAALSNAKGVALTRLQRYDEAIAELNKAVKLAPREKSFRANLAAVQAMNGLYVEAFESYKMVVPEAEAHYLVAGVRYAAGETQSSIAELELALAEDPRHGGAKVMLERLQGATAPERFDPAVQPVGYVQPTSSCSPDAQR